MVCVNVRGSGSGFSPLVVVPDAAEVVELGRSYHAAGLNTRVNLQCEFGKTESRRESTIS